jgi:O-methyltransferase
MLVRNLAPRESRGWSYDADGLATMHYSPFEGDPRFAQLYDEMAARWFTDEVVDARWRMWTLTRWARYARTVPGDYAEFGTYRGGCAWMVLSTADLPADRRFLLFDTFAGIPHDHLTPAEREADFGGRLADTSVEYVAGLLAPWGDVPQLVPGDVFETAATALPDTLAFAHIDLNASAPTIHALELVYERLSPSGVIVFDDYGWRGYEDQRARIDAFVARKPEEIVALPTGQALLLKAPA